MLRSIMRRKIRLLDRRDLDAVLAIESASFTLPWTKEMMAAEFEKDYAFFIGSFKGDILAGFCLSWVLFDEGHIADFAVHPRFRRKGVGGGLLDAVLEEMAKRGGAEHLAGSPPRQPGSSGSLPLKRICPRRPAQELLYG